ncbi:MAG: hypothetical protein C5B54_02300 [Acidobacteria bacterium]|nr:MAG: hypothetical protein C5B54_02300 [Acidobacteriota bacterium]
MPLSTQRKLKSSFVRAICDLCGEKQPRPYVIIIKVTEEKLTHFSLMEYYKGTQLARVLDLMLIILLVFFILYTPLPFGSVQNLSIAIIELFSIATLVLWMIKLCFCGRRGVRDHFRKVYEQESAEFKKQPFFNRHYWLARVFRLITFGKWPRKYTAHELVEEEDDPSKHRMAYFSLFGYPVKNTGLEVIGISFLLLMALQLIPLPAVLVRIVSPATSDLYRSAAMAAQTSIYFHPLSLNPFATFSKLLLFTAYFIIYLVVVNNIRSRQLFFVILYAIFVSAVFQGVYGLYEFLSGNHHIFQYTKKYGLDSATGTFINRNHFAAYLELSLPLLISLVVGRIAQLKTLRGNLFSRLGHALETEGSQILLILLLIVLVSVGLIFSLSRSGISFALISLVVFLILYRRATERLSRRTYLVVGIVATVALAVWIGLNPLAERFLKIGENWEEEGARWQVWVDTFRMFLHFPLFGTGAGTFQDIFPMYRSFVADIFYRYAHKDYLQTLSETGICSLLLVIAVMDLMLERIKRITLRTVNRRAVIQISAFCALLSFGLHSITDFSFQIPAIAVQASIIMGILFSHYHTESRGSHV